MQVNMYGAADAARKRLAEQTAQQGNQGDANQGNTAASHELFHTQIGVGNRLDGGRRRVKKYLWSFLEPPRRGRSGCDLLHFREGFEIKMNFDRNVSCFIFVNALMHDDFFD